MLARSGMTRSQLEQLILQDVMASQFQNTLQGISPINVVQSEVQNSLSQFDISFIVYTLTKAELENILKAKADFSEDKVQAAFKADYATDNPEAKLTSTVRAAIEEKLFQQQRPAILASVFPTNSQASQKLPGKATSLNFQEIVSGKAKENKSIQPLLSSVQFYKELGGLKEQHASQPIEIDQSVYLVKMISKAGTETTQSAQSKSNDEEVLLEAASAQAAIALNTFSELVGRKL